MHTQSNQMNNPAKSINPPKGFKEFTASFVYSGNINSPVWICGLEYGRGWKGNIPAEDFKVQKDEFQCKSSEAFMDRFWAPESPFCHGVLKSLAVLKYGKIPSDFCTDIHWLTEKGLIGPNGLAMILNAFPISMAGRSQAYANWEKNYKVQCKDGSEVDLSQWTTIPYFWLYKQWVIEQRASVFCAQRKHKSPKLIICTGNSDIDFFYKLWGARWDQTEIITSSDPSNIYLSKVSNDSNKGNTVIAVVPFFGYQRYTLNSYARYNNILGKVADYCEYTFGKNWLS